MTDLSRRALIAALAVSASGAAAAQDAPARPPFRFEDVARRARDLASVPFEAGMPHLPDALAHLDYDAYRDIRFRPDKALLGEGGGLFRMQLFHLGALFQRPVTVNVVRDGVPIPVPYQASLFDLGRTKLKQALPVTLGFAGLRLHYPLNRPDVLDEVIAYLGASYFRFLGRDQRYGLSARALAVNAEGEDGPEEFPFFREFWVETPSPGADRAVIYGLMDGPSLAAAYQFIVYPGERTVVDVRANLYPRRALATVGLAPLTSMFFIGENDRHHTDDYRPELHDSDGLLMQTGGGEWIWRPLRNPPERRISALGDRNPKGFGLMQRDRAFEDYQDLEAFYHRRPSYWVTPHEGWGEGSVQLIELPTDNETHDNVVAAWRPKDPLPPGREAAFSYTVTAIGEREGLHPGGRAVNTYEARTTASGGSAEPSDPTTRRFLIDFSGGDLAFYLADPKGVEVVPSVSNGRVTATSVVPNLHVKGFRAAIDVKLDQPGQSADIRAFLRVGTRTLSETWTYPWTAG